MEVVEFNQKCPKCEKVHRIYGKLKKDSKIDEDCKKQELQPFPGDSKLNCSCGCVIDISDVRNKIEIKTGKKLIIN